MKIYCVIGAFSSQSDGVAILKGCFSSIEAANAEFERCLEDSHFDNLSIESCEINSTLSTTERES